MSTPLSRVLVTRSPEQASALADRLRDLGAEPVLIPAIETVDPHSFALLDTALAQLSTFDWLLFTSANAVEAFAKRRAEKKIEALLQPSAISAGASQLPGDAEWRDPCIPPSPRKPSQAHQPRIAAIGPATARALTAIGLVPDLLPPQAVAESLTESLLPYARQPDGCPTRFLLVRAEQAREHLPNTLRAAGAEITVASAYRTVLPAGSAERIRELFSADSPVQAVTFTSSSTARNLFTLLETAGLTLPDRVVRASIGPITSATLQELGFPPHVESPEATVESLAESLVKYLTVADRL